MKRVFVLLALPMMASLLGCNAAVKSNLKFDTGNYAEAIPLYKQYLAENPKDLLAKARLAYSCYRTGRMDEALKETESIRRADDGNPEAALYLGEIMAASGDFMQAAVLFDRFRDASEPGREARAKWTAAILRSVAFRMEARAALENERKGIYPERVPGRLIWAYYRDTSGDGKAMAPFRKAMTDCAIRLCAAAGQPVEVVSRERMHAYVAEMGLDAQNGLYALDAYRLMALTGSEHGVYGNLGMASPVNGAFTRESFERTVLSVLSDTTKRGELDALLNAGPLSDFDKGVIRAGFDELRRIDAKIDEYRSTQEYTDYQKRLGDNYFKVQMTDILKVLAEKSGRMEPIDGFETLEKMFEQDERLLREAQQRPLERLREQREKIWKSLHKYLVQFAPPEALEAYAIQSQPIEDAPVWMTRAVSGLFRTPNDASLWTATRLPETPETLAGANRSLETFDWLTDVFSYSKAGESKAALSKRIAQAAGEAVRKGAVSTREAQEERTNGGGGGGGSCFAADTSVLMADGSSKRIVDVRIGDTVSAYDVQAGRITPAPVIGIRSGRGDYHYVVNGIRVVPPHPFYSAENRWIPIRDLREGQIVRISGSLSTIRSVVKMDSALKIHNIIVETHHNFFVSGDGKEFFLVKEGD